MERACDRIGSAVLMFLASAVSATAADLSGPARVVDGDTVWVGETKVRLQGLAAPEKAAPGGSDATAFMRDLAEGRMLTCAPDGTRSHDRIVAICRLEDGRDIAEVIVGAGLARDCPNFSGGRYAEAEVRAVKRGATIRQMYPLPGYCR